MSSSPNIRDKINIFLKFMVNSLPFGESIEIKNEENAIKIGKTKFATGKGEVNITIQWMDDNFNKIPLYAKVYTSKPRSHNNELIIVDQMIPIDEETKMKEVLMKVLMEIRLLQNHIW